MIPLTQTTRKIKNEQDELPGHKDEVICLDFLFQQKVKQAGAELGQAQPMLGLKAS